MPRDIFRVQMHELAQIYRRQAMDNGTSSEPSDGDISSSLSSACECQTYSGSTVTVTYTNEASVGRTLSRMYDNLLTNHRWSPYLASNVRQRPSSALVLMVH